MAVSMNLRGFLFATLFLVACTSTPSGEGVPDVHVIESSRAYDGCVVIAEIQGGGYEYGDALQQLRRSGAGMGANAIRVESYVRSQLVGKKPAGVGCSYHLYGFAYFCSNLAAELDAIELAQRTQAEARARENREHEAFMKELLGDVDELGAEDF